MLTFDTVLLGFIAHSGLLLGSTLQITYLLSRGMANMSTFPMATVFVVSGMIASGFALFASGSFIPDNHTFEIVISTLGIVILLREAYKSYKRSQTTNCCMDTKIHDIIFAISIVWLNTHIYADIVAISAIAQTIPTTEYLSFFVGFNAITVLWFYGAGLFAKNVNKILRNNSYHQKMHLASAIILVIMAGMIGMELIGFEAHSH
ncbi:MAG: hypothetical protein ACPG8V_00780 [Alphaproteobacteria bacterium]